MTAKKKAPSDVAAGEAWDRCMAIAREHALVCDAAHGIAVLAVPREQRKSGSRARVLQAHFMEETDQVEP